MPTLMPILFLKCVVGTVRVKSVYTCTAQTVQFSRGQGSHHRLYTVQLQESCMPVTVTPILSCLSYPLQMVYLREKTTSLFLSEIHWRLIFSIADYLHI